MKSNLTHINDHENKTFFELSPLERIRAMHAVMSEIIALKAKGEGVAEYEIYRRYLKNNPRHYQKLSR